MTEMPISVTDNAIKQMQSVLETHREGLGIRLKLKNAGCSGFAYEMDIADAIQESDTVLEFSDVKIIIDEKSFSLLSGTKIDFVQEGLNSQFKYTNANAQGVCGCGESFSL